MPTNRKRLARGRVSSSGIMHRDYIYFTWGSFFEAEDYEEGKTKAELKAFWKKHRAAILERYFADGRHRGQRPWPFWQWEMPEPKKIVRSEERWRMKDGGDWECLTDDVLETDFDFLKRLGLLSPWEMEATKDANK